ncbi:DEAD/DEAH box helicase [Heterostelium album PN500]|uniref:DEAD/DEAH box helicase n=1 Tax=Heterostelium pallidum (strain ATCC 26659 / Pp 5 / PN500) TaxID=670386 RepID=D3AVZ6_HETP5|nr:DEAD/DEAH box helicase [Heterostelium album PN500]EFA86469.1 DEAD/DEAH box helicase [Heterostelium album PN500]|eukprot:XP_020438574.1 DEAD/DEAH box helicase [Heterostelium album PN500]
MKISAPLTVSSVLRLVNGGNNVKSLDTLTAKRNNDLARKKNEKKKASSNSIINGQLSWNYFANATNSEVTEKQNRNYYNQFLQVVIKLVDNDEVPSEELHSASYQAFMAVANPNKDDVSKQQLLRDLFGSSFKLKLYNELVTLVSILQKVKDPFEEDIALSRDTLAKIDENEQLEWGSIKLNSVDELFFELDSFKQDDDDANISTTSNKNNNNNNKNNNNNANFKNINSGETIIVKKSSKKDKQQQQQSSSSSQSSYNESWLIENCITISKSSGLPADHLLQNIINVLKAPKNIQDDLIGILGFEYLDFIEQLITNRTDILASTLNVKQGTGKHGPVQSFSMNTTDDKLVGKLKKKDEKKKKNASGSSGNGGTTSTVQIGGEQYEVYQPKEAAVPAIYTQNEFKAAGLQIQDGPLIGKAALPANTIRKEHNTHIEVTIPHAQPKPFSDDERFVPITEIAQESQKAFGSIKSLNRIQSRVFETAYKTNENLLICAPTGAGKTNIALLTILHEIENNYTSYGVLNLEQFKIIYIAPLKALAAEMTEKFASCLKYLGIVAKELTGDMQLTQKELKETQIIVTTPEKWDVITRKSTDVALTQLVRLLIIDEIHLLHEERGPVLESIVARTLRQVETTQEMIRIVGLSATLPNYKDVARFINSPASATYCFDSSYRPVPMTSSFLGVKEESVLARNNIMNQLCYDKLEKSIREGYQVMVFVHSRKDTAKTAEALVNIARSKHFRFAKEEEVKSHAVRDMERAKSKEIRDLFQHNVSIHHAGLLRQDRNLVEKYFAEGAIKVLVCTATLAWGVNLPAHTVIIKGTQLYDSKNGGFIDLGISDVMQIFGRAGRPQFDTFGESFLITSNDKLDHYLMLMSSCLPIESRFINNLSDNLNAEIVLGTVSNVSEASRWLSYTYLYIRMITNPHAYGINVGDLRFDPDLSLHRNKIIERAAIHLDKSKMIRYDAVTGNFFPTDLGRIASHYYIKYPSIETFHEILKPDMSQEQILTLLANSSEFENVNLREEEVKELTDLSANNCFYQSEVNDKYSKVKVILQSFLSRARVDGFSLVSDSNYIIQNSSRILRGLFEITMKRGWCSVSKQVLDLCKMIDHQQWHFESPLRQLGILHQETLKKLEEQELGVEDVADMEASELAPIVGNPAIAKSTIRVARQFPKLEFDIEIQPITSSIIKINLQVLPYFEWNDRVHGDSQPFWFWIEDSENEYIYNSDYFILTKRAFMNHENEPIKLSYIIPMPNPLPSQFFIHYISDRWLNCDERIPISFKHLIIPHQNRVINTELLDLQPLPVQALKNPEFEKLFKFSHFNPIQTQVFHTLYHTNNNVLLGSPTGSGKTICAELAMFKVFRDEPSMKVVYIAPLKALVRERMNDWNVKLSEKLGKKLVELTGDYTPNMIALQNADVVTTTPEKWDGISRNWKNRSYVTSVSLLIIDEIHLLGELRGPTLEVIVSRMKQISKETGHKIRIIGLSTAMANAVDLAEWMGIEKVGLFNFRPSCRPVPIEVHIQGFAGKHYCPRMQTMNKPAFAAIKTYSPNKSVLIFVSSRRQTRLTALDLISHLVADDPTQWLHTDIEPILDRVRDGHLKHTLSFGIGMHHAGLNDNDRSICETLFAENKIQILISTSTLAWGVNLPAHLVIVKGTEYFDGRTKRYVDYPLTDVLQMMGRAGRPQFDKEGKAVIMVHEPKKNFYKKFLYDPFPVESHLKEFLHDHLNAEIVAGTIQSKQGGIEYLTNTFFFRRLLISPTYYGLQDNSVDTINRFLSELLDRTLDDLAKSNCIIVDENDQIEPSTLGRIASFYYLNYRTIENFTKEIKHNSEIKSLLKTLCDAYEYHEFPVRHNEDLMNKELNEKLPIKLIRHDDPHTKVHLLLQAHFERAMLPISDYVTDTKSALDQGIRILQAMIDVAGEFEYFATVIQIIRLLQMFVQGRWDTDSNLLTLPYMTKDIVELISKNLNINSLKELTAAPQDKLKLVLDNSPLQPQEVKDIIHVVNHLPRIKVTQILPEKILAGRETTLKVKIQRMNKLFPNGFAYAPQYPKNKDEGWIIILTDEKEQFLGLKRISQMSKNSTSVVSAFTVIPPEATTAVYHVKVYSDNYIGLDYFHTFSVKIDLKK